MNDRHGRRKIAKGFHRELQRIHTMPRDLLWEEIDTINRQLQCLHELPNQPQLLPRVSIFDPAKRSGAKNQLAQLPIQFMDGIPLLVAPGYEGTGPPPSVESRLQVLENEGKWIRNPLTVNNKERHQVFESLAAFRKSSSWRFDDANSNSIWEMLENQVNRFLVSRENF